MSWTRRVIGVGKLVSGSAGAVVTVGLTGVSVAAALGAKLAGVPDGVKDIAEHAQRGIDPCVDFAKDGWRDLTGDSANAEPPLAVAQAPERAARTNDAMMCPRPCPSCNRSNPGHYTFCIGCGSKCG